MYKFLFLSVVLLCLSCDDGDISVGKCPNDPLAREVAGYEAWVTNCDSCHASDATRNGAPDSIVTDNLSYVRDNKSVLYGEIVAGSMPPSGSLSGTEKENVRVWLACGAKSEATLEEEQGAADTDEDENS